MFNLPIEYHNEEFYLEAVKKNHKIVNYVLPDKVSSVFLEKATAINGRVLQFVPKERQTLKLVESAVKDVGFAIKYSKINPTYEISLLAVKRHPMAIRHIEDQNEEIVMAAVSAEPKALEFVKNKTPDICLLAIRKRKDCYGCVDICPNPNYETTLKNLEQMVRIKDNQKLINETIREIK